MRFESSYWMQRQTRYLEALSELRGRLNSTLKCNTPPTVISARRVCAFAQKRVLRVSSGLARRRRSASRSYQTLGFANTRVCSPQLLMSRDGSNLVPATFGRTKGNS